MYVQYINIYICIYIYIYIYMYINRPICFYFFLPNIGLGLCLKINDKYRNISVLLNKPRCILDAVVLREMGKRWVRQRER